MNCEPSTTKMVDQKNLIMQNEPNFQKTKMNITSVKIKDYKNKPNWTLGKNEHNLSKTNPISNFDMEYYSAPEIQSFALLFS